MELENKSSISDSKGISFLIKSSLKDKVYFFAKILFAVGIIFYLNSYFISISPKVFEILNLPAFLIAIIFSALNIYIQFAKWKLICSKHYGIKSKYEVLKSLFAGIAVGIFTPARLGEFIGRAFILKGYGVSETVFYTIYEKMLNLFFIIVFGLLAASIYFSDYSVYIISMLVIFVFVVIFGLLGKLALKRVYFSKILRLVFKRFDEIESKKELLRESFLKLSVLSAMWYLVLIFQYMMFVVSYSGSFRLTDFAVVGSLVFFATSVIPSFTLGDLGIREGASVFFITGIGLAKQTGFNASVMLFLCNIVLPSIIGLFFIIAERRKK